MRGFKFSSLLRRRWLWALAGFLVAIPATVLAWLYWWILPNLPQYKDEVAGLLSSATGYTITIDAIDGEWGGARPRFKLEGVRVLEDGRPLLYFSTLEGRFGWRTLVTLEPRLHELYVDAPGLTVRRARDGVIHVGGLRLDPNSQSSSFSDWLLRQGEVRMQGVTVAWIDDTRDSQPLVLRNVSLQMQNLLNRHAFQLSFMPPAHLARPVSLDGVLNGRSLAEPEDWRGKIRLNVPALELAAWRPWLPVEHAGARGHGSLKAELEIDQGKLSAGGLDLNFADVHVASPRLAAPLELARLSGQLGWTRERNGMQTVFARGLSLAGRAGTSVAPLDLSYGWSEDEQKISAAGLSLSELAALAPELPLEDAWRARLDTLAPRGRIDSLDMRWRGKLAAPEKFFVDARFTGLGWAPDGEQPGAANLSGMLVGNEEKGSYTIFGKGAGVDLPAFFAEPQFRFDILNVRGGWKRDKAKHYTLDIAEAALSNADLAAALYGKLSLGSDGPGWADLTGRLERANGPGVERYLPLKVNEHTHTWLRNSVLSGKIQEGAFKLQGDLANFPFKTPKDGLFRVTARLYGGQIRFNPDYPQIDDIEGDLLFEGSRMEIRSDKARILGARLQKVKAVIPDLDAGDAALLEVDGESVGPAPEFIRFVNSSPVGGRLEGLTKEMTATGDLRLQMNIKVPLQHARETTVAGRLFFDGNVIQPEPALPRIEQVSGTLDFTDETVTAQKVTARILGGPATITAATENGQVRVGAQGASTAASLQAWLGQDIAGRLSGRAGWKGELWIARGKTRFRLESNLVGLGARLPAPLEKAPGKSARLVFEQQGLGNGTRRSDLQYGNTVSAAWLSSSTPAGHQLARGEINFGGKAQVPEAPGMRIAGSLASLDLGGWLGVLPQGEGGKAAGISAIDLNLASLDMMGRRFNDIALKGGLKGNLLRVAVTGREMSGNLTYRGAENGTAPRVSAQFRQFTLPDPLPDALAGNGAAFNLQASGLPTLDLQVEELNLGSRPMGRLEAVAHGTPDGMAIEQLNLLHPDSVIRMSGTWKASGLGETRMKVKAEIKDAGLMLARFDYPNTMNKGSATVEGEVTWLRSPADFTFDTLDGTLKLTAKNGQFLKVEPGAGKLLGIASLQSLRRRIALDFRDVFSEGFAFDEISSTMQVADGSVYTDDFLMKGPAATVKMSGVAKLRDESVRLRVKVIPKLSEGVAVAGALLGGPIAGVGALVVQKVLKDPIEEAISYEYLVDGPWENPAVTKLAKPKSVQEKEPGS